MADLSNLERPQRARLFPILSETSKEGRTLSIFLATLASVRGFAQDILGAVGQRVGPTAKIKAYTEVTFKAKSNSDSKLGRPDGLIVVEVGKRQWTALVEAKVGKSEISAEQLERYLEIAKVQGIDAVITISNQFSTVPSHHPVHLSTNKYRKIELFHFSWMHIMTVADLLTVNKSVEDDDQLFILKEFLRFISHDSAGVEGFTQMPHSWSNIASLVQAGGLLTKTDDVASVVEAWQQETKDLCLILSRQLGTFVGEKLSRAARSDGRVRYNDDLNLLTEKHCLEVILDIPDAASPLAVRVDFGRRTIMCSMNLGAPEDKASNKGRLNWLLRQIPRQADPDIHIRLNWPGSSPTTQHPLAELRADPDRIDGDKGKMKFIGFEIVTPIDLGGRFAQRRTIIQELERAVPSFYESVGQHLKAWQPAAPKLTQERAKPEAVALTQIAEESDLDDDS